MPITRSRWAYGYGTGGGSFRNYPNCYDPLQAREWGPSPNDERNHITVAGVVNLPKGFEFAPIMQYGSARPYEPTNSGNTLNTGGGTECRHRAHVRPEELVLLYPSYR